MHFVFHSVEAQDKQRLKGNLNSLEFKCKIDTLAQALLKGMFLPQIWALSRTSVYPSRSNKSSNIPRLLLNGEAKWGFPIQTDLFKSL